MQPGRTTNAAWERCPNNDSSSIFVHHFLAHLELKRACNLWSLSAGNRNMNASVSIIMAENVIHVSSSVLWIATAKPRWSRIRRATDRALAATSVAWGPRKENNRGSGFGPEYLPYEMPKQSCLQPQWKVSVRILTLMAELDPHIHFSLMQSPEDVSPECVVSLLQVHLHQLSKVRDPPHSIIHRWVWDRCQCARDAIVDTVPKRKGQVHNHLPLVWLRFGNQANWTRMDSGKVWLP